MPGPRVSPWTVENSLPACQQEAGLLTRSPFQVHPVAAGDEQQRHRHPEATRRVRLPRG